MVLEDEPLRPESAHTATGEETESKPSRRTRNDVTALNPAGSAATDAGCDEKRNVSLWNKPLKIGTWNVRTMKRTDKLHLHFDHLRKNNDL